MGLCLVFVTVRLAPAPSLAASLPHKSQDQDTLRPDRFCSVGVSRACSGDEAQDRCSPCPQFAHRPRELCPSGWELLPYLKDAAHVPFEFLYLCIYSVRAHYTSMWVQNSKTRDTFSMTGLPPSPKGQVCPAWPEQGYPGSSCVKIHRAAHLRFAHLIVYVLS